MFFVWKHEVNKIACLFNFVELSVISHLHEGLHRWGHQEAETILVFFQTSVHLTVDNEVYSCWMLTEGTKRELLSVTELSWCHQLSHPGVPVSQRCHLKAATTQGLGNKGKNLGLLKFRSLGEGLQGVEIQTSVEQVSLRGACGDRFCRCWENHQLDPVWRNCLQRWRSMTASGNRDQTEGARRKQEGTHLFLLLQPCRMLTIHALSAWILEGSGGPTWNVVCRITDTRLWNGDIRKRVYNATISAVVSVKWTDHIFLLFLHAW